MVSDWVGTRHAKLWSLNYINSPKLILQQKPELLKRFSIGQLISIQYAELVYKTNKENDSKPRSFQSML